MLSGPLALLISSELKSCKHGISIILKLVSIEYQKWGAFLAAL